MGTGRSLETFPYQNGGFKVPEASFLGLWFLVSVPPEVPSDLGLQVLPGHTRAAWARDDSSNSLGLTRSHIKVQNWAGTLLTLQEQNRMEAEIKYKTLPVILLGICADRAHVLCNDWE